MPVATLAHHSSAAFDLTQQVVVQGTLKEIDWANLHAYLAAETRDAAGQPVLQQIEALSISSLQAGGLKREFLVLGSEVSVRAHPNRRQGFPWGLDITSIPGLRRRTQLESPMPFGRLFQPWARALRGERESAADSQAALTLAGSTGNLGAAPALLGCHAETLRLAGDFSAALQAVELALGVSAQIGRAFYDAELHRQRGELYRELAGHTETEAEEEFELAVEIARRPAARSLELRATLSLAHLWCDQGKRSQAVQLLQPVYARFTEGLDLLDLVEAKALLQELGD